MGDLKKSLLSTTYLGPIEYYGDIISANEVLIEQQEHYIKQTYRNRCIIATANETQILTIPVIKVNGNRTKVKDVQISYAEKWQMIHWRAINSAYSHSPFFLYYKDKLEPFYNKEFKYLLDFNSQLLETILKALDVDRKITFTEAFDVEPGNDIIDMRNSFHPKINSTKNFVTYIQVFGEKFDFLPNLSIIDLLFNEGPSAADYLRSISSGLIK